MAAFSRLLTLSLITSPLLADSSSQPVTENSLPELGSAQDTAALQSQLNLTPTQSSQYSSGGSASAALGNGAWATALKMDLADKAKRGVFSISGQIDNGLFLSLTASGAQENAGKALGNSAYSGASLNAGQLGLGLDYALGQEWLKTLGAAVAYGATVSAQLDQQTDYTHLQRLVDTPTSIQTWQDSYATTTTTTYQGSHWVRANLRTSTDIGPHGELITRIGGETNALLGTRAIGGVSYQHYLGPQWGKASVSADANGPGLQTYSAQYEYPINHLLAINAGVRHSEGIISDTQGQFGISLSPDNSRQYQRPLANALAAYQIAQRNLSDPLNTLQGLANYGKVVKTVSSPVLTNSQKISETIKNTPTTLSAINGPTTLAVAQTGIYSFRVSDVDGVDQVTARFGEAAVQVYPLDGELYQVNLTPVSGQTGPQTLQIEATGKKADGSADTENKKQTSLSVTVSPEVAPETPTTLSAITGPASVTVGNTATYTFTTSDADGIASVTGTIDGTAVQVDALGNGEYRVIAPANLTAGSHALAIEVIGKKKDGSADTGNKKTATKSFSVVEATDTTAPTLTSSPSLGSANIGDTVNTTLAFSEAVTNVTIGTLPTGMTATYNSQTRELSVATNGTFTNFGPVQLPVTFKDASNNPGSATLTITINDVPLTPAGAFAALQDMTVSDMGGGYSIDPINAGGVTDALGRDVTYTVTGLPTGLSIDPSTRVISGTYDAGGFSGDGTDKFNVTIETSVSPTNFIRKTFVLSIRDDG